MIIVYKTNIIKDADPAQKKLPKINEDTNINILDMFTCWHLVDSITKKQ